MELCGLLTQYQTLQSLEGYTRLGFLTTIGILFHVVNINIQQPGILSFRYN